jgi:hypothetical protein
MLENSERGVGAFVFRAVGIKMFGIRHTNDRKLLL